MQQRVALTRGMTPTPIAESEPARPSGRRVLAILFAVYIVLLVWLVMWKFEAPWVADGAGRDIKLIPYVATATAGANSPTEVLENTAIFIPFGIYLPLVAPKWRWWSAGAVIVSVSVVLEVSQYILAVGSSDTADLIDNTLGGLIGIALVAVIRQSCGARTATLVTRVGLVGTVIAVVAVAAFIASPIRLGPHNHTHLLRHNAAPGSTLPPRGN